MSFLTQQTLVYYLKYFKEKIIYLIVKETARYAETCEINNDSMVSPIQEIIEEYGIK